jgi:hypothetical protein
MLWLYQRVMFGKLDNPENMNLKDLNLREAMTLIPIIVMCVWIGVYPKPFTEFMDAAVKNTVSIVNPDAARAEMQMMQIQAAREEKVALPPGHPPVLPAGHPPLPVPRLPAGHAEMIKKLEESGSGSGVHAETTPAHSGSGAKMEEHEHSGPPGPGGGR